MSSWPLVRLGDLCDKITDGTHHSPASHAEGDFKYVTAKNIKPWGLDLGDISYIDAATHRGIYSRCDVRRNDVLYVKDGATTGRVALNTLDEEFSLLSSVAVLRAGQAVRPKYLLYALQESKTLDRMLGDLAGVAITRLTLRKLKDAEIPLAPLRVQDRIVEKIEELLSDLDAGVAELKAAQRKLTQYRQSLLKAAVEGSLTADWHAARAKSVEPQETGAALLQRILTERRARWEAKQLAKFAEQGKAPPKDWQAKYPRPIVADTNELPALPEGWIWATVDQVAEVFLGKMLDKSKHRSGEKLPYLRNVNVRWGSIDTEDLLEMFFDNDELERYGLVAGDVLVCEGGEPGRSAVCSASHEGLKYQKALHRVRLFGLYEPELLTSYLELYAKSGSLETVFTGSTIKHFTKESFLTLHIPIPPLDEQKEIVERILSAIYGAEEQGAAIAAALKLSAAQRRNILKAAFAGQLVPQDSNEEPAAALLERIGTGRVARDVSGKNAGRKSRKSA